MSEMLTVEETIRQRRSIRRYRPEAIPRELVLRMLEAARLAPSASNCQPWRFLIVVDAEEKRKLREMAGYPFVETAPMVVVCAADLDTYSPHSSALRYRELLDSGILESFADQPPDPKLGARLSRLRELDRAGLVRRAMANTYIAIEHLVLAAASMGIGTCWVGAVDESEEVRALFELPESIIIVALVAVGYPAEEPRPRPRLEMEDILLRPLP
jgi:nitroreductase